jgi:hypothetical protein
VPRLGTPPAPAVEAGLELRDEHPSEA